MRIYNKCAYFFRSYLVQENHITVNCPDKEEMEKEIGNGISSGVPKTMENVVRMAVFIEKICKLQFHQRNPSLGRQE